MSVGSKLSTFVLFLHLDVSRPASSPCHARFHGCRKLLLAASYAVGFFETLVRCLYSSFKPRPLAHTSLGFHDHPPNVPLSHDAARLRPKPTSCLVRAGGHCGEGSQAERWGQMNLGDLPSGRLWSFGGGRRMYHLARARPGPVPRGKSWCGVVSFDAWIPSYECR